LTTVRSKKLAPVLLAGALAMTACGGSDGGGGSETAASGGDNEVSLRVAHVFPESSPIHRAAEAFAEAAAESNVEVTVFPGGALGGDTEMGEGLISGNLDCAMVNHPAAGMDPRLQLGFLPYIVTSYDGADELFYGDGLIAQNDREVLGELGVTALAFYENDFRGLTNNQRTVTSPDDLNGLKIRIPELPAYISLFQAWGAQPLPIAFPELYTALQQGTVDGQDNGVVLTFDSRFQEVQKFFTRTNHAYGVGVLACNSEIWETLSADQQNALTEAAEAAAAAQVEENRATVEEKLEGLREAGVEVTELTDDQLAAFQEVRAEAWAATTGTFGQELLDALEAASAEAAGA